MKRAVLAIAALAAATAFADKVYLKSGSVLTGSGAVVAGDKVKFKSDDLGDVEIASDKVAHVETAEAKQVEVAALPLEQKPPETWHGSINVAFESARGNTYKNNASVLAIDSCYNTRRYPGLPCGPISNPGALVLISTANPADTSYLYFLTGDDGLMYYSNTEAEHNQNARDHCQVLCNAQL